MKKKALYFRIELTKIGEQGPYIIKKISWPEFEKNTINDRVLSCGFNAAAAKDARMLLCDCKQVTGVTMKNKKWLLSIFRFNVLVEQKQ